MLLDCQNITKEYNGKAVLQEVQLNVDEKEKCALVGINGAGKSTLMKIIMGQETPDQGQVILGKETRVGYLAQEHEHAFSRSIYEELRSVKEPVFALERQLRETEQAMKGAQGEELERLMKEYQRLDHNFEQMGGYTVESDIRGVLHGLGFSDEEGEKLTKNLSGGQKTRVALGRILLEAPDLILLDEPTNHLDLASIEWLEGYLKKLSSAILLVSHDRFFLDRIVTKVTELEAGKSRTFRGNYTEYAKKRSEQRIAEEKAYKNQQAEIAHQKEVIAKLKQFNREKSIKRAESREKQLSHMEVLDKPVTLQDAMRLTLSPAVVSGNDVLQVTGLSKAFGDHTLFNDLEFSLYRGERVALIGANGTGKTTILKILNRREPKDAGQVRLGAQVSIGYYDQEHQVLSSEKTIFDEISDAYPTLDNTTIRSTLAAFLFTGDQVFKEIHMLSGGERGRVSLAKLMLSNANFLMLDEPTNHLDVTSREVLEHALTHYTGTVLFVSHDRYFINRVATRILELSEEGLKEYVGNYDNYLERKAAEASGETDQPVKKETEAKADWKTQKEEQAKLRKRENDIKKMEALIAELEEKKSALEEEMQQESTANDYVKWQELSKEHEETEHLLNDAMDKWMQLNL